MATGAGMVPAFQATRLVARPTNAAGRKQSGLEVFQDQPKTDFVV